MRTPITSIDVTFAFDVEEVAVNGTSVYGVKAKMFEGSGSSR